MLTPKVSLEQALEINPKGAKGYCPYTREFFHARMSSDGRPAIYKLVGQGDGMIAFFMGDKEPCDIGWSPVEVEQLAF